MTKKAWYRLRPGSIIRSKGGSSRMVIDADKGSVELIMIRSGEVRLWSGVRRRNIAGESITTYSACDRGMFKVHRY